MEITGKSRILRGKTMKSFIQYVAEGIYQNDKRLVEIVDSLKRLEFTVTDEVSVNLKREGKALDDAKDKSVLLDVAEIIVKKLKSVVNKLSKENKEKFFDELDYFNELVKKYKIDNDIPLS